MIPEFNNEYEYGDEIEIIPQPSFTHKMWIEEERVKNYIYDDLEALRQMIYKCINTERGVYPIYPSFGVKKEDLFGKRKEYAYIVLTRRITDALVLDDRIEDVFDFSYVSEWSKEDNLGMKFKVKTIFDEKTIDIEEVIRIG